MIPPDNEFHDHHAFESLLERFEQAWHSPEPPRLEDFLIATAVDHRPLLRDLVHVDLEYRLRSGQPARVEEYLARFPELGARPRDLIELLAAEYRFRCRQGERPTATEYLERFPQLAAELSSRLSDLAEATEALALGQSTALESLPRTIGRYRVEEEIARGGMGQVVRLTDDEFQRSLAMKVLLAKGAGPQSETSERFLREARLTGRLQHPGIPPVHELGRLPDDRPYFIMKLVQGQTLHQLLWKRVSAEASQKPDAQLLAIFEQVCQTLAYAHSCGVIHRDLKPANIMVGAFGEVQVMDWGLAKVLRQEEAESGVTTDPSLLLPPSSLTQTGEMMGTPAYMPPEQARGEVRTLDERCDVFGLGALLCEMLTGRPPFAAGNAQANLRLAQKGDLAEAFARLDSCAADAELVRLARLCLAPDPKDRPANASAVAAAVSRYQADLQERLQQAELERAAAEARADEEQKRRQVEQAKVREERKRRRVQLYLGAVVLLLIVAAGGAGVWFVHDQADREQRQARLEQDVAAALEQARQSRDELQVRLREPGGLRALLNRPADWKRRLESARGALQRATDLAANAEGPIAGNLRQDVDTLDRLLQEDETASRLALQLDRIREDRSAWVRGQFNLDLALRAYAAAFRDAGLTLRPGQEKQDAARIQSSPVREQLLAALDDWAYVAWHKGAREVQTQLLRVARLADPAPWKDRVRDPATWKAPQKLQELADQALASPDGLKKLSPQMLELMGFLLTERGDAERWLRRAQALHPADFWLNFDLAHVLQPTRPQQAEGFFRAALGIRPDSIAAWNNLGTALLDQKDYPEAIACFRQALAIDPKFAYGHFNWGDALRSQKDWDGAIDHYRAASKLVPEDADVQYSWGICLGEKQAWDEAIDHYRRALQLDPRHAKAHFNWGAGLTVKKDWDGAIDHFQQALAIDPKDGRAHFAWGTALRSKNDLDGAIEHYRKSVALDPHYAPAHTNWANVLAIKKDFAGAIEHYRQALKLDPTLAQAHCNLGQALMQQGQFAEALVPLRRGHELGSRLPGWPYPSADWIAECQELLQLDQRLSRVLQGQEQPGDGQQQLALALLCAEYKKQFAAAVRFYAGAFAAAPQLAATPRSPHRFDAACVAILAAAGQGQDAAELGDKEKARLRDQALVWLKADLEQFRRLVPTREGPPDPAKPSAGLLQQLAEAPGATGAAEVLWVEDQLTRWQTDPELATVRAEQAIVKLPPTEQNPWRCLWTDVQALQKRISACFAETQHQGKVTAEYRERAHEVTLTAATTYVFQLQSNQFEGHLRLQEVQGRPLAESAATMLGANRLARIVFPAHHDGKYRLVVSASANSSTGAYTLLVRRFVERKK